MNSYILLRDNKESGSLRLEDLQKIGLKASDLIWVECQSVGWRNPHEIAELRPLLTEKPVTAAVLEEAAFIDNAAKETITEQFTGDIKKKLVYVELPPEPVQVQKQVNQEAAKKTEISDLQKYAGLSASADGLAGTALVENPEDITTKYSRPLEEIKEMYVKNLQQRNQRKISLTSIRIPKQVKKGLLYTGFVLVGAVIMLLIKDAGGKRPVTARQDIQPTPSSSNQVVTDTALAEPVRMNLTQVKEQEYLSSEDNQSSPGNEDRSTGKTSLPVKKNETAINEDSPARETTEKKNTVEEEPISAKPTPAMNLASQLSVKANDYEIGSFGGIRNLEMTLRNDSKYLLDKVVVELKYLNPEGIILKTEDIYFKSVYPGEAETVAVKKTKRGVKITYKITAVESKEIGASTTGL